jgi:hypothetical protein
MFTTLVSPETISSLISHLGEYCSIHKLPFQIFCVYYFLIAKFSNKKKTNNFTHLLVKTVLAGAQTKQLRHESIETGEINETRSYGCICVAIKSELSA